MTVYFIHFLGFPEVGCTNCQYTWIFFVALEFDTWIFCTNDKSDTCILMPFVLGFRIWGLFLSLVFPGGFLWNFLLLIYLLKPILSRLSELFHGVFKESLLKFKGKFQIIAKGSWFCYMVSIEFFYWRNIPLSFLVSLDTTVQSENGAIRILYLFLVQFVCCCK